MIGFLKELVVGKPPKVTRDQVMAARPLCNPLVTSERGVWHEGQPRVVLLRVPRRADRLGNIVASLFRLPSHRQVELDEMGSDVWEMCDGTLTVDALTRAVCSKYHLNRRQGEASVTAYLRMLAERRLILLKTGPAKTVETSKGSKSKDERTGSAASRR